MSSPIPPGPSGPHDSSLPPSSPQPTGAPGAPPRRPRGKLPWILGGACALLVLLLAAVVALGALWFFVLRESPQDVTEKYLEAWTSQDCETFEEISTEDFRGEGYSCEAWQQNIREQTDFSFEHEIGETEVDGDRASVEVFETITVDGTTDEAVYTVDMVRQDGDWLLDGTTMIQEPDAF